MKRIQYVIKGIALAAVPIGLQACDPFLLVPCDSKTISPQYALSPEELNAIAARNPNGEIRSSRYGEERVDGGPFTCDDLCLPPEERNREYGSQWGNYHSCNVASLDDGSPAIECHASFGCEGGRRPQGFAARRAASSSAAGAWLAELAQLEAASVPAFARLRDELIAHSAPSRLVRSAERARCDEVRHARMVSRLARRHGAQWSEPHVEALPVRSLEEVAEENAVEGCVHETYGALLAQWQSSMAGDSAVRRAMGPIAADESRHAALAWDVDAWAMATLSPRARRRIRDARAAAAQRLCAGDHEASAELVRVLGLPNGAMAAHLLGRLRAEAWS